MEQQFALANCSAVAFSVSLQLVGVCVKNN